MAANLKGEMKKAVLAACKKEGHPPIIDKTLNSVYDEFKKSQPLKLAEKGLNDQWKDQIEVWSSMDICLKKYIDNKKICELTVTALKKIYGETPSPTEVRLMVT